LHFSKYHGLGNDFIIADLRSQPALCAQQLAQWSALARAACDRRTGIGADGLLLIEPVSPSPTLASTDAAPCQMRVINSDGSDGGMCGNGIRCVAHMLVARRHAADASSPVQQPLRILAGGSVRAVEVKSPCTPLGAAVRVAMGSATIALHREPIALLLPELAAEIAIAVGPGARCSIVDVGNPHLVIEGKKLPGDSALALLGPRIERHPAFPNRTNVQCVMQESPTVAHVRTWERGSGITQACGTGACAVGATLATDALATFAIELAGGALHIECSPRTSKGARASVASIHMTGPAAWVFDGILPLPHAP
jgi:diaminopimelate epimerase